MEILRVTDSLWQRAAVFAVRVEADVFGLGSSLEGEFKEDNSASRYILIMEDIYPVSTCRIDITDKTTANIERVATHPNYQGKNYGRKAIEAAEKWLIEEGIESIYINSRTAVQGFYEKLGYAAEDSQVTGEGTFECIMMFKKL